MLQTETERERERERERKVRNIWTKVTIGTKYMSGYANEKKYKIEKVMM
jgi:hypothetical protein